MFTATNLNNAMRAICSALQIPVICLVLLCVAVTVVLIGSIIMEFILEHRHLKVQMPKLVDELKKREIPTDESIRKCGLLKRQKKALIELTLHKELTNFMREALAVRLLHQESSHYDGYIKISDTITKIGPALGLLGTLIPLGPGIIALGQGDVFTLSQSMLVAFDTTILGLACASAATVISTIRKKWYANYASVLETIMECVLEVEKQDD